MMTRRAALTGASAFALSACANTTRAAAKPTAAPPASTTSLLISFLEHAFEHEVATRPELATELASRRGYGRWDDETEAAAEYRLEHRRRHLITARDIVADGAPLDPEADLSMRLFEADLAQEERAWPWRNHVYRFNQMSGAQSALPAFLINQHQVASVSDAEAYVSRLQRFKLKMDQILERSQISADAGLSPPRFVYDYVLADCRAMLAGAPFAEGPDNPLLADFTAKVGALDISEPYKNLLRTQARAALRDSVGPAYVNAIEILSAQQARAGTDDGVWRLRDGEAYYAFLLARYTTTAMSAHAIHEIGLSEVARIHGEMDALKSRVGFRGSRADFFRFTASDPRFLLPATPAGRADYVRRANAVIEAMNARLPRYFGRLPRAPLEVRPVEAFREHSAGLAFYERGAPDGSRPGVYYVNTSDVAAIPITQIEALAYHEGVPGHHLQIAIAQELENIPSFRRYLLHYTAYSEGWGLYAEGLAKEMGFYEDPYSDFGRLTLELRRAIRLVVDTGLHHKRWTRAQAIQYVLDNQPGGEAAARRDIDRYIVYPGQATAYKIGQMEILRLREAARAAMGARFDLRGFHDTVLGAGPLPLDILGDRVRAWAGA